MKMAVIPIYAKYADWLPKQKFIQLGIETYIGFNNMQRQSIPFRKGCWNKWGVWLCPYIWHETCISASWKLGWFLGFLLEVFELNFQQ